MVNLDAVLEYVMDVLLDRGRDVLDHARHVFAAADGDRDGACGGVDVRIGPRDLRGACRPACEQQPHTSACTIPSPWKCQNH
jgi:hypothetical protein